MDSRQTSSLFVFLIIFLCLVIASSLVVYGSTHESSDRDSLLAFRSKIFNDPLGSFNSWNESTHFCNWTGVTCGKRHRSRVTVLDLGSKRLEGTLSPHIGNLSFLRTLNLLNNNFTLEIPQELGALFRLQILRLDNNSFSGEIPTNLSRCSNLNYLSLRGNNLGGELPSVLGVLSKLQSLNLNANNFVGKIPPSFGNLSSLQWMRGQYNKLYGSIPSTLGQLKNLEYLSLGGNKLFGPISTSIFNISSLTHLALGKNAINGSLPIDIGLTLPKLETLLLHTNRLSGLIPVSISNLTSLQLFDISGNRLTGDVPYLGGLRDLQWLNFGENGLGNGEGNDLNFMSSFLNCTNLKVLGLLNNNFGGIMPEFLSNFSTKITGLYFGNNRIKGRIPSEIGNLINLERLSMEENLLTGSIPSSIDKLRNLNRLTFGRNKIRGRIPSEIGNLINLEILGMEGNLVTGSIPSSIGKLQKLFGLYLGRNKLSGQIPSSIGNLSSLGKLFLSVNELQGIIPPSIGGCRNLQLIYLYQNNLSGTIPKELLSISSSNELDLSRNSLTGLLPTEVGKLVNLRYLNLSENNLFGELPHTLGSCTTLEELYLRENFFHGEILSSFKSLRGLQFLDLSCNNLSGQVPNYLETFALMNLNLSWNDFEGELPQRRVFSNLTGISVTRNKKLCGGIPELHLPSCIPKKSKKSRSKLIVSFVSVISGMMLVAIFIFIYMSRKKRKLSTKSSSSIDTFFSKVSYHDLFKATNGFSSTNLIGVGGFGSVYKGILGQERLVVAIKVLNLAKKGATKSFMAECEALRSTRHRNLVKIVTACSSVDFKGNDFKALVYEFMINGSLDDWLHPIEHMNKFDEEKYLNFVQRFNIVVDVANVLDYMHNECQTPIVHCDLKPSNILVDEDMVARVGDFGLARLCLGGTHQFTSTQSSSLGIKGSIGYAAPEYGIGSEISTYGDVYSFGIVLLEIFTGKRPTDSMFKDGLDLHNFAKMALPERVMHIADPIQFQSDDQYRSDKFLDCFILLVKLGVACSVESPRGRINIKMAVEELVHIKDNLLRAGVHL